MKRVLSSTGANLVGTALIGLFLLLQLFTVDYGTKINDVPYIAEGRVGGDIVRGSGLERDLLVTPMSAKREGLDLWLLRFKLYSVEADEVVNIVALARIKPHDLQFDPRFYQYGGAYLYPLGAWFYALNRLGVIELGPLPELLASPQRMDLVWIFGRAFILLSFVASAACLFAALKQVAPPGISLVLLALYLACPASIAFSQVIKPHWYALLWVNVSLLVMVRGFVRRHLSLWGEVAAGVSLGLAVGSSLPVALFSIFAWIGVIALVVRRAASVLSLVRVPAVALGAFALTNPYYFINWKALLEERRYVVDWFRPSFGVEAVLLFIDNSAFAALGVALTISFLGIAAGRIMNPGQAAERVIGVAMVVAMLLLAGLTAGMSTWHTNIRYAPYVLPMGLLLLGLSQWRMRAATLWTILIATAIQAAPLKLAYFDENDPENSTRLRAAAWIDQHIPPGQTLCLNSMTPSPYEVPPFKFELYDLTARPCSWKILVERQTDAVSADPDYVLVQRFRPRLSPAGFPFVIGHINPQISIYRRA